MGLNDNVVDNVNYVLADGIDTVYQFVRGVGGDKLNFTGKDFKNVMVILIRKNYLKFSK